MSEIDGNTVIVVGHHPLEDLTADHYHGREHPPDGTGIMTQDLDDAVTPQADRLHRTTKAMGVLKGKGLPGAVAIELDLIHLQLRLAHDRPEDLEGDAAPHRFPAALLLRRDHEPTPAETTRHRHHPCHDLVLIAAQ
ncbi:MAG: hypothetical protein Q9222_006520 [Ikaeria aurantiellina]